MKERILAKGVVLAWFELVVYYGSKQSVLVFRFSQMLLVALLFSLFLVMFRTSPVMESYARRTLP
jgi:hypothetical protein